MTHIRNSFLNLLRAFPPLYRSLRFLRRAGAELIINLARTLCPRNGLWGPPKGTFSDLEFIKTNRGAGKIIVHSQKPPCLSPTSLRRLCKLRQDEFQPWPIFWSHHREARLAGSTLVLLDSQKRASFEAMYYAHCYKSDPGFRYLKLPKPIRLNGNWTSVVSRWATSNYYHWAMDALPRLALLSEFPPDTKVIVPDNLLPYQHDSLKWLGLEHRIRPTPEWHIIVENFYFSSPTAMTGCFDPYAAAFLREKFLKFADCTYRSPKRFYVQRRGRSRGIINEEEVVAHLRGRGWEILDCAQLTMAQQIQLFSNAESICALHGAALTNLLWCRPGCKVFEIVADNYQNGVFEGIAEAVGAKHQFLISKADSAFRAFVEMPAFKSRLEE